MPTVRIFYRNRQGKDNKVMGWSLDLNQNPPNEFQLAANISIPDNDISYQSVNAQGVPLKKVIGGVLYDRAPADIDKDSARKYPIIEQSENDIIAACQGRERITWVMFALENMWTVVKDLQAKANIADNQLSTAAQTAKGQVEWMRANISGPIATIMANRDAAIAALDQED